MLTALELAQKAIRQADEYDEAFNDAVEHKNGTWLFPDMSAVSAADRQAALTYAAVAQAEALDRIASILERIVSWDAGQETGDLRIDTGVA